MRCQMESDDAPITIFKRILRNLPNYNNLINSNWHTTGGAIQCAFDSQKIPANLSDFHISLLLANHGYTYENNLLYFPLYPLMIKGLSNIWNWFGRDYFPWEYADDTDQTSSFTSPPAVILLASIIINIPLFALAADRLYLLSRKVLK